MEKCSICNSDLILYEQGGIKVEICKNCKSVHISKEDFAKLAKHIDANCEIIDLFEINEFATTEAKKSCTKCNTEMEKVYYNGVIIDRCKNCNLLIFEDGELSKYFSKFSPSGHEIINNAKFVTTYFPANAQTPKEETNEKEGKMQTQNNTNSSMKIQSKEEEFKAFYSPGIIMLIIAFALGVVSLLLFVLPFMAPFAILSIILLVFILSGFRIIKPQEAMVLTFFGKYAGSIKEAGFH